MPRPGNAERSSVGFFLREGGGQLSRCDSCLRPASFGNRDDICDIYMYVFAGGFESKFADAWEIKCVVI